MTAYSAYMTKCLVQNIFTNNANGRNNIVFSDLSSLLSSISIISHSELAKVPE